MTGVTTRSATNNTSDSTNSGNSSGNGGGMILPVITPGKLNAQTLIKSIRNFDGNKTQLSEFISSCETAMRLIEPLEKPVLLELIKLKLVDRAYHATKFRTFEEFKDLKELLIVLFGEKQSRARLETSFYSCKQGNNETVMQFTDRIEEFMYKLIDCVTSVVEEEYRRSHEDQIRIQARNIFINGLRDPLGLILRARDPESLEDAIGLAVAEEREQKARQEMQKLTQNTQSLSLGGNRDRNNYYQNRTTFQNSPPVNYQNRGGFRGRTPYRGNYSYQRGYFRGNYANSQDRTHRIFTNQGQRQNYYTQGNNRGHPSGYRTRNYSEQNQHNQGQHQNSTRKYCTYCKIPYHDISECRTKKRTEVMSNNGSLNFNRASNSGLR